MEQKYIYSTLGYDKLNEYFVNMGTEHSPCPTCGHKDTIIVTDENNNLAVLESIYSFCEGKTPMRIWSYLMVCDKCGHQTTLNAKFIYNEIQKSQTSQDQPSESDV